MAAPVYTLDDTDYLDLASLRANLNFPVSYVAYDDILIAAIKAVSRLLDDYSGKEWWYSATRTERHKPMGQRFLLNSCPVTSVVSIETVDGLHVVDAADIDLESPKTGTVYVSDTLTREGLRDPGINGYVNTKIMRKNYIVTYESGYETPTQSATGADPLPFHVRSTLLEVASHIFLSRAENLNIKREHLLESANWYDYSGAESLIARKLSKYGKLRQA